MKTNLLFLCLFIFLTSFIVEDTIIISGVKVPCSKVCYNADYDCRATGIGPKKYPLYKLYKKERPDGSGKSKNYNYFNLGRSFDVKAFNYTFKIIDLKDNEVEIDTAKIDYDLKKDNITNLLLDLEASLKASKVDSEISAEIQNDYKKTLDNYLILKANLITYTMKNEIMDSIRDAQQNINKKDRFVNAVQKLNGKNYPLIRQVIVIEEICKFKEEKDINNLLKSILKAKLGDTNPKVDLVLNITKSNSKTSNFSSSYSRKSIYSYGFWSDPWMFTK